MSAKTYVVIKDADKQYPLKPGVSISTDEIAAMLRLGTIAVGSRLLHRGRELVVVRKRGKLQTVPAEAVSNG